MILPVVLDIHVGRIGGVLVRCPCSASLSLFQQLSLGLFCPFNVHDFGFDAEVNLTQICSSFTDF